MALTPEQLAEMDAALGANQGNEALFAQMDEVLASQAEPKKASTIKAIGQGLQQVATFGLADELQALGAGIGGAIHPDKTFSGEYERSLGENRQDIKEVERNPVPYIGAQVGGAIAAAPAMAQLGGAQLAKLISQAPVRTASGLGALQGALYGFGSGEGGLPERAGQAGVSAGVGALAGPAGAYIGKGISKLGQKAGEVIGKVTGRNVPNEFLPQPIDEIMETASQKAMAPKTGQEGQAANKVIEAIKRDYPDNWQQVVQAWREGDVELAKLGGENVSRLAKGAAQYRSGEAVTKRYFEQELPNSVERSRQAINRNISGNEAFQATVDDVLTAGRLKAAPQYEKAYRASLQPNNPILEVPEVYQAINAAKRKFPSELKGEQEYSVKVLDYAKRILDDQIETAQRQGQTNFARSRTQIKNQLLNELDAVSPDYARARKLSGDYLSVTKAMDDGVNFMGLDSEMVGRSLKGMSQAEKDAFRIGVGKKLRDIIDNQKGVRDPYNAVFGSKEQQKRLAQILSPEQFINLEKSLKAEKKLFELGREVLGGSPTTSKAMAAGELAQGGAEILGGIATGGIKSVGIGAVKAAIGKAFDGMNDRTADAVSRLLYETDPIQKVVLLEKTLGGKALNQAEKQAVKRVYFQAENFLKSRAAGAAGATAATMPLSETQPDLIVRPQGAR